MRQKKVGKAKFIRRDKEGQFILIKETINKEDITVLNIYSPNSGTIHFTKSNYWTSRHKLTPSSIIISDFNITLSSTDRSSRLK